MQNDLPVSVQSPASRREPVLARPPHPLDANWQMRVDGDLFGPYTGHELEAFVEEGRLEGRTEVRRMNGGDWIPARGDVALARFFDDGKPPARARVASSGAAMISGGDRSTIVNITNTVNPHAAGIYLGSDKSPGVALLLSLLIVGTGQIYNGDVGKGILMMVFCVLLWVVLLGWIINLWSIIDAYVSAKRQRTAYRRSQGMAMA